MKEYQKFLIAFGCGLLICAGLFASFWIGRKTAQKSDILPVKVDSVVVVVRDTIREKYPVYLTKEVVRTELLKVTDTLRVSDTLYQAIEIERKTYESDDYRAVVSGWHPSLDEIAVFPKTVYLQTSVTETKAAPRLSVGVSAGPGMVVNKDGLHGGIAALVGLSYRF